MEKLVISERDPTTNILDYRMSWSSQSPSSLKKVLRNAWYEKKLDKVTKTFIVRK